MKKLFFVLLTSFACCTACKKPAAVLPRPGHPQMVAIALFDSEVKYNQSKAVDLNRDGRNDLLFEVWYVGDPVLQRDRFLFYVDSDVACSLLNNLNDETPVMHKGEWISGTMAGYIWYPLSAIVLAEKQVYDTHDAWAGRWLYAAHQYLPVQLVKNNKTYYGWVELSFNKQQEKLVLHKAAICTEEGKAIQAGYF